MARALRVGVGICEGTFVLLRSASRQFVPVRGHGVAPRGWKTLGFIGETGRSGEI
jgi:hypothetical protein